MSRQALNSIRGEEPLRMSGLRHAPRMLLFALAVVCACASPGAARSRAWSITLRVEKLYDPAGTWGRPYPSSVTLSPGGKKQRKVITLPGFRPHDEYRSTDWFSVDARGRTIAYLAWDKIRVIRLAKPL